MAGFFDQLRNLSPEQNQGLLAAAAQILQQSGPSRNPNSIGQILGGGLQAYQGSLNQAEQQRRELAAADQQARLQGLRIQGAESDLNAQAKERDVANRINQAATSAVRNGSFDQDAFLQSVNQINPLKAIELQRQLAKAGPEFDTKPQVGVDENGQPFTYIVSKSGQVQRLGGVLPREELKLANLGGRDVAYNPFQLTAGQTFNRTQSPDSAASVAATLRGQNLTDARAREGLALQATREKAPTEFQGKSAAFGLRAEEADKTLRDLQGKYSPAKINSKLAVQETPLLGGVLGAATNLSLSEQDQKAEQAQRDFVNAVLRQESGAAIGNTEFDNARRQYFPQPGDSAGVIQQKARNRQLAVQGLNSNAGRARMTAPAPASSGGWSIQRVGE